MKRLAFILSFCVLLLARLDGQSSTSRWAVWARQHANPISALQSNADDAFEDLQFLKTVLKDRRIVQLGESGHSVAEFNQAKVRLRKFLNQQMGFVVIAFESDLYECLQRRCGALIDRRRG